MNWITDRPPTKDDADDNGDVWVSMEGLVQSAKHWSAAAQDKCDAWMRKPNLPEPYTPPVDTSLAASIEGWELCELDDAEQSDCWNGWKDGKYEGANDYRRRVVMTDPPSQWNMNDEYWNSEADGMHIRDGAFMSGYWYDLEGLRHVLAWCHRLPSETEPPQFLLDSVKERSEPKYIELAVGDVLQEGDEYKRIDGSWYPVSKNYIGQPIASYDATDRSYRRPIPAGSDASTSNGEDSSTLLQQSDPAFDPDAVKELLEAIDLYDSDTNAGWTNVMNAAAKVRGE